mmetsp:Transcript_97130/g.172973  ORF Transcript_97130/g.172973 Transcript_97130/m.172973 type:complete len:636 (-) Transcript_97130:253-2160(-)
MTGSQLWEVKGGSSGGGILVREGEKLASPELPLRLATGAVIKQKDLRGERLHFELVTGAGPNTGWVSLKMKGKDLVVPFTGQVATGPPSCLKPSTVKGKILMLSVPWKGHMVHMRRIGLWFIGRPGFEVHIACFPEYEAEFKELGFQVHVSEKDENHAVQFFKCLEDVFRDVAQSDEEGSGKSMLSMTIGTLAEAKERGEDPFASYFSFCFRVMTAVKPDVVLGDGFCTWNDLIGAWCHCEGSSFLPVHSPGIPEDWEDKSQNGQATDVVKDLGLDPQLLGKAMGMPPDLLTGAQTDGSKVNPQDMTLMGAMQSVLTLPPQAAAFMGAPISKKLKLPVKATNQLLKARSDVASPAEIYPSTRNMVGTKTTRPRSLFTSPLLPLPAPLETGELQRDRKTFEETLGSVVAADLSSWLFSEDEPGPVVYVAFGSIVRPSEGTIRRLAEALDGAEEWRVLWVLPDCLEKHLPSSRPPAGRWRVERFVPQADVLKCNRVKCFLSHMGANSTTESLVCGVPMMCCPFYLDQHQWAAAVSEHLGAGLTVSKSASPEEFRSTLRRLLNEPKFAERASRSSRVMRAQADAMLAKLGPDMAPPEGTKLGPGASVCAAAILASLAKESTDFLFQMMDESTNAAEDA